MSHRIDLGHATYFEDGVLHHGHNAGFFSNLSTCLWALARLYCCHGRLLPEKVVCCTSFRKYMSPSSCGATNAYPLYFTKANHIDRSLFPNTLPQLDHHGIYSCRTVDALRPFVEAFFLPNERIMTLEQALIDEYSLDPTQMIGVWYRGTDKSKELRCAPAEAYLSQVMSLLSSMPDCRVWLQTDQKQVLDYFRSELHLRGSRRLAFVNVLPVTTTAHGIHVHDDEWFKSIGLRREEYGQILLATLHILAQCKCVVTCTGNIGYWIMLYRGLRTACYQDVSHTASSVDKRVFREVI